MDIINEVVKIVDEAGEMLMNRDFEVSHKGIIYDKVTSTDIAVEKFLKERLLKLIPNSGFLGEESEAFEIDNEYVWVVDPIDGTANFVRDLASSCVSVGLLKDGEGYLGVINNPYLKEIFYAQKGSGAYVNGKEIKVSDMPFEHCMYFSSMTPYSIEGSKICLAIVDEVYENCDDYRRYGSAAIELCMLAAGRGDLYFKYSIKPWDYAAGAVILEEAGGVVGSVGLDKLTFDKPINVVAANNKENYDRLYGIVEKHLKG